MSTTANGRQTVIDISWNAELQCGHVELLEEVEKDPNGGVPDASTPPPAGAASSGLGSSSTPMTVPFILAMERE